MSAKPTPGPWQIEGDAPHIIIDSSHNPVEVAKCSRTLTGEANARLIAAAPDLLEALLFARSHMSPVVAVLGRIDAAIAKATGGAGKEDMA